jgi:transcription elongation factor GreA
MSEKLIARINERLNEEKWTRATLNNYTVGNFKELDEILDEIFEAEIQDDVSEICEEHLQHTKNSIVALYLSGVINLKRQRIDDSNLVMLINIFTDNHKWNIVEYLCNRILEFGENKYALKTLADCYNNENQLEKMYETWERLIKVDYEEADIVRALAEKKEEEGKLEEAVDYYKKALHRYINKRLFNSIKEVWHKLIQYVPEETEFFQHAEGKIAKMISEERAVQLLEDLYPHFKEKKDWNRAIDILKRILDYDSKNPWARKEIIDCFTQKHADHSHLDEYIKISNLNQSWRNVHDAIADFEKHIAFDSGNFVFHRAWGVGIIRELRDDSILIDFAKKRGHKMSLKMAVNALEILAKDHIWVLRSIWKKDKLHDKVKGDIVWALKTVIKSADNAADMKRIKAELVPSILTPGEWSSWSTKARNVLKTNQEFGNLTDKLDHFVVRDQPITFEEKTSNKFKAEKNFFDRVKTFFDLLDYINTHEETGTDSDYFREMFDYFVGFLRSPSQINEFVVASTLIVGRVVTDHPYLNPQVEYDFKAVFDQIENLEETFSRLDNSDLKKEFVSKVQEEVEDWPEIYARLFPLYLSKEIVLELQRNGHIAKVKDLFSTILDNYRDFRESFVWMTRYCVHDAWFKKLEFDYEKILIGMIHLLDITYRDIDNRRDVSLNRKINKQIHNYLFKDNHLSNYIESTDDQDSINRIYTLVKDVKELDPSLRIQLKQEILDRFPDFQFYGETEEKEVVSRGFITTSKSYEEKQAALRHIHEVEVPQNSKEISEALAHGDLRENAEYKAAKERQDMLNNTVARLKEELERVQIVKPDEVEDGVATFGTKIRLKNNDTGEIEEYTLLGPWESDPDNAVISYQSPLGNELYNHTEGDELQFKINEREYNYRVEKIEVAEF